MCVGGGGCRGVFLCAHRPFCVHVREGDHVLLRVCVGLCVFACMCACV